MALYDRTRQVIYNTNDEVAYMINLYDDVKTASEAFFNEQNPSNKKTLAKAVLEAFESFDTILPENIIEKMHQQNSAKYLFIMGVKEQAKQLLGEE